MEASQNLGAGTDFKLFASMVTSKPFENLMANQQDVQIRMKKFKTQVRNKYLRMRGISCKN